MQRLCAKIVDLDGAAVGSCDRQRSRLVRGWQ